ncbi:MAG: recombinase family protein [Ktedonobacterales bacterium]|nr:recombinase family protein [Ktedonobacterales bacterium]
MPRSSTVQRLKAQKQQQRRWDLPPGSHVWCYLRHSPGDMQTIDSQVLGMTDWCAGNGWIIDRMFTDEALEGSREDRDQFQEMIAFARQGPRKVDGIAVWSFARFARDQLDAQFYKAELRKLGYAIVSKIDDVPNNEMAPIYEAFIDWKNQRFLEDLSADVKRGQHFIVDKGYWPGGNPPVGFTVQKEQIGRRRNGDPRLAGRLVKDEAVAEQVELAWKMKREGNASLQEIHEATHLYSKREHYSEFFNNLLYTGIFVYHGKRFPDGWEGGQRFCESYVTLDEFLQIQQQRQSRTFTATSPRRLASAYLLTGLLRCGLCLDAERGDAPMNGQCNPKFPTTRWYRCATKMHGRGADCAMPRTPTWYIEEAVCTDFVSRVLTVEYIHESLQLAQTLAQETHGDPAQQLALLEKEIREQREKLSRLLSVIERKGMNDLIEGQYDRAQARYTALTNQLATLRAQEAKGTPQPIDRMKVEQYVRDMHTLLAEGPLEERRDLLKHFIKRVVLYLDRVEIEYVFRLGDEPNGGTYVQHFAHDDNGGLRDGSLWGHRP